MPSNQQTHPPSNKLREISTLIGVKQDCEVQVGSGLSVAPGLGLTESEAALLERAERIENNNFRLAVVGSMGRGKSTLINALLGEKLLPVGSTATTAVITQIVYGQDKHVTLVEKDGNETCISRTAFKDAYVLASNDEIPPAFANIAYAVLESDNCRLCEAGLEIVDTLGFDAMPEAEGMTQNYLNQVDAVLLVLNAFALFDDTDLAILDAVNRIAGSKRNRIFLVINARTLDADKQTEIMESVQSILAYRFDAEDFAHRTFVVNAEATLKIRCDEDTTNRLEMTGLPAFEQELTHLLNGNARINTILDAAVCDVLIPTLAAVSNHIEKHNELHADSETDQLATEAKFTALQQEVDAIKATFDNFTKDIGNTLADNLIDCLMQRVDTSNPKWQALDLKPGPLKLATSQFASEKQHQLAFEIAGKLTKYFHENIPDVKNAAFNGLEAQISAMLETLEEKVSTFTRKLDAASEKRISQLLTEALQLHTDLISRFVRKDARLLTAVLTTFGVALLGPFLPFTNLTARLLFIGSLLSVDTLLFFIRRNKGQVKTQIRKELNDRLEEKHNQLKTEIQQLIRENSKDHLEKLRTALKTEIQHQQRQSDTAVIEKRRLETIHIYLIEEFEVICQAVYGRVLSQQKQQQLLKD